MTASHFGEEMVWGLILKHYIHLAVQTYASPPSGETWSFHHNPVKKKEHEMAIKCIHILLFSVCCSANLFKNSTETSAEPLQIEMLHESICIPAFSPFFCRCSYVKTKEECFWAKISVETVAMQQHNTALIQSSNFSVWLLFFPEPACRLSSNAMFCPPPLCFLALQKKRKVKWNKA